MGLGMGLCINNTRAVLEGLVGHQSGFLRTPKYGVVGRRHEATERRYVGGRHVLAFCELGMAAYFVFVLYYAWTSGMYLGLPFLLLFYLGFLYSGLMSTLQPWMRLARLRLPRLASRAA